jgi:hypothetical protein
VMCSSTQAVVRLDAVYNTTAARAVAGRCNYAVVPVVGSLSPGGSVGGEYPRLLREGYVLEWRASAGDCGACSASGGQCGYDSNADAFACVCADGSSRPARCSKHTLDFLLVRFVDNSCVNMHACVAASTEETERQKISWVRSHLKKLNGKNSILKCIYRTSPSTNLTRLRFN